nr:hypothetical protein [uncultured Methanolobus sp.]
MLLSQGVKVTGFGVVQVRKVCPRRRGCLRRMIVHEFIRNEIASRGHGFVEGVYSEGRVSKDDTGNLVGLMSVVLAGYASLSGWRMCRIIKPLYEAGILKKHIHNPSLTVFTP